MELFFSHHKEPRGRRLLEMAQQLNDARVGISEMHLAFDMLLDFIFAFCFLVIRWLLTALAMAHVLKAGKSRNRENGETAPTLPFSPFSQGSKSLPRPFRRLPCRSSWPRYMKNALLCFFFSLTYYHTSPVVIKCIPSPPYIKQFSNTSSVSDNLTQFCLYPPDPTGSAPSPTRLSSSTSDADHKS